MANSKGNNSILATDLGLLLRPVHYPQNNSSNRQGRSPELVCRSQLRRTPKGRSPGTKSPENHPCLGYAPSNRLSLIYYKQGRATPLILWVMDRLSRLAMHKKKEWPEPKPGATRWISTSMSVPNSWEGLQCVSLRLAPFCFSSKMATFAVCTWRIPFYCVLLSPLLVSLGAP